MNPAVNGCRLGPDNVLYDTALFREVYNLVGQVLPCWLSYFVAGLVIILILANAVLLGAAAFSWMERGSSESSRTVSARTGGVRSDCCSLSPTS